MKGFIYAVLLGLVVASPIPDQSHHQVIKQGNAPSVSHSVHKAHGAYDATVVSQPHAAPQSVHAYHNSEKYSASAVAPAAKPAPYTPANPAPHAPVYKRPVVVPGASPIVHSPGPYHAPIPTYHKPSPAYHKPAPTYQKPSPAYHKPAPTYQKPALAYHKPAPSYHKPAPAYHKAAPAYQEPESYAPEPYTYEYAVADDYSKSAFNAAESSDASGNTAGSYSVALPDGRTQHVTYTANGHDGFIAEVTYEGTAVYPEVKPYQPAPAYHPAPKPSYAPIPVPAVHA